MLLEHGPVPRAYENSVKKRQAISNTSLSNEENNLQAAAKIIE
jgi:hypothetical protein